MVSVCNVSLFVNKIKPCRVVCYAEKTRLISEAHTTNCCVLTR